MMAADAPKTNIILTSRDAVAEFLAAHPDPDETITWACPECNARNVGAYHSHISICGACGKGHFPAIPLPIIGDAKTSVKRAFVNDRLYQIEQDIKEYNSEILGFESEIEEREDWIRELVKERENLKHMLHLDLCSTGDA